MSDKLYLTVFPHIQQKLEALDVEYEPPSVMPYEELKELRDKIFIELGRNP
jgi:hypothetical protein